jgi:restriction system protein
MTFREAAEEVLRRHSPGAPLHYRRISELALADGLVVSKGTTPEATMGAQLYTDIKRRAASGKAPRFRNYGRGLFGLATPTDPLGGAITRHNADTKERLRALLADMDARDFELLIGYLLSSLGFENVEVTSYSGDGGIDVRATLTVGGVTDVKTAVQVKRWAKNVPGRVVRELRGALGAHERGLIITLSDFTKDAINEGAALDRAPITLVNGDRLLELLIENDIGVTTRTVSIIELDEASLSSADSTGGEGADLATPTPPITYKGSKALAIWPMPGGRHAWKASLERMLRHIADTAPTYDLMTKWIIETFDKVSSAKVARHYVTTVLRPLGFVEISGEQIALSAAGSLFTENPSNEDLLGALRANIAGVDELLDHLSTEATSNDELLEYLRERLGVSWETDAQINSRLGWLENAGVVREVDHGRWARI